MNTREKSRAKNHGAQLQIFFATIARIDHNIGRLREFLDKHGLADNTILIFLADNGTSGADSHLVFNAGMRGKKGSTYEGGHRVPCFIHWPAGGLNKKRTIDELTSCTDILPTLKDLCKLSEPKRELNSLDGISIAPLIDNPEEKWPDRTLIYHVQNGTRKPEKWKRSVVLHKKWRLIDGKTLYNLENDFAQKHNISSENEQIVRMLKDKYESYWKTLDVRSYSDNPSRYVIGASNQKIMVLTGADGIHLKGSNTHLSYSAKHTRSGNRFNIYWPLEVREAGRYSIEVRRWPRECDLAINAGFPKAQTADARKNGKEWFLEAGKALAVKKVVLKIGNREYEQTVEDNSKYITFLVDLEQGDIDLKAHLVDKNGPFSAYYVYIEKQN